MSNIASALFLPWVDILSSRENGAIQESLRSHSEMVADYMITDFVYGTIGLYIIYYVLK
jgi:hypothetical protein|tara:strand:+ start:196 stop:372 length:177 start_codon:yes stop_codon:yes gene_type:complete